ncbi:LamG domain-containing protein [uncultured Gilvimarinus sp.]|uniref:LamG domain-containing protein n=1 Tax=uncultured Gilvimarinus sp. TaxID=1689143 RepID=UPI0030D770DC
MAGTISNCIGKSPLWLAGLLSLALLAGCGSGSGEATTSNVKPDNGDEVDRPGVAYDGPAPLTEDVQNFKLYLWDNLAFAERCGSCHVVGGNSPMFVRTDDINQAYQAAVPLVDLHTPQLSTMVSKVAGGHNCWLDSDTACADIITGYITEWASAAGSISNEVVLTAPEIKEVGGSKNFPADSGDYASTVYPLVSQFCSGCHAEGAPLMQQPYIGSADVQVSYEAARSRMRLDDPARSRLVERLAAESHNCWSNSCASDASAMADAIAAFADLVPVTEIDPALVTSKALQLGDGTVASANGRADNYIIARYEFKTGSGAIAYDTSGVNPAVDLTLYGDVDWMSSWGLRFNNGKAQASTQTSRKLFDQITSTGEYSIEAWVIPSNVSQEDARIVSYSGSTQVRNLALDQNLYNYTHYLRSSSTDGNGMPALATLDAEERAQASLQHVVVTFDPVNGRRIYVDGELTGGTDPVAAGNLNEWDSSFALVVGNEVSSDRVWNGAVRFLAVHNRALSAEAIASNFDAGVGETYYLLFSISDLINVTDAYVVFQVQQFDDYSYLFSEPFFTRLSDDPIPTVPLEGIRIGVNGREAIVGQVFAALETDINAAEYANGMQPLSRQGAVVALEQGSELDTFFITFDQLGEHSFARVEAEPPVPQPPADIADQPTLGLKSFASINASLAAMTGISHTNAAVQTTYAKVEQQLPTTSGLDTFVAAQQMGITQLAVAYCNALVNDTNERAAFFPGFNFGAAPAVAFNATGRSQVISPLLNALVAGDTGGALNTQANPATLRAELNGLIDTMGACGGSCSADRTATTVKATCAAALGSAVMLVH